MPQRTIHIVAGTFAVGAILGFSWPHPEAPDVNRQTALPKTTSTVAVKLTSESVSTVDAEADFTDRVKAVTQITSALKRARAVSGIADNLDATQIRRAIEEVLRIHIPEQSRILETLYSRWAELEPEVAFASARDSKIHRDGLATIVKRWAAMDAAAARKAVDELTGDVIRKDAITGLIEGLSESDARQAWEVAMKSETYSNSIDTLFKNWMEKNPEEAVEFAMKFPPGDARRAAVQSVATKLAEVDVHRALNWAEKRPDEDSIGSMGWWDSPMAKILGRWMDEDPEAALRWLRDRPTDSKTDRILAAVSTNTVFRTGDPELSAQVIQMMPVGDKRKSALSSLLQWWDENNPDGALAWIGAQDAKTQSEFLPGMLRSLAFRDPSRAMKLASNLPETRKAAAEEEVVEAWTIRDPAAAAEWLHAQPENAEQLAAVAAGWVLKDAAAATEWINSIESGAAKDHALYQVADRLGGSHPEIVAGWVAGIGDEQKRREAFEQLADIWLVYDPAAARKWIADAPMPEDLRIKLTKVAAE